MLAIVQLALGIFALVGGIIHLTLGIGGLTDFSGKDLTLSNGTASALQDAFTIEGLILLVSGYAVWTGKKWGWTLTMAIAIIGLITSIGALIIQSALSVVGLVANIGIIAYSMTSSVKRYFGSASSTSKPGVAQSGSLK